MLSLICNLSGIRLICFLGFFIVPAVHSLGATVVEAGRVSTPVCEQDDACAPCPASPLSPVSDSETGLPNPAGVVWMLGSQIVSDVEIPALPPSPCEPW